MVANTNAALEFLRTAFEPDDWVAIFLKSYVTGHATQRVGPLSLFLEPRVHAWLRAMNAQRFNICERQRDQGRRAGTHEGSNWRHPSRLRRDG